MNLASLLPPPWNIVAAIAGPLVILGGAYGYGHHRGYAAAESKYSVELKIEKASHAQDIAIWRQGGIKATADALQSARNIEQKQQKATQDAQANLDTLHARNAELTRLWLAARADHGSASQANLPYDVGSADGSAETAPATVMVERADLPICNTALETAQGWQDLYRKQHAIDRNPE